ncbi:MAG TPA: sulfite exporter TauE/SafE family protein [Acidimicrobiales bacterium]|nr:sulfite exporter TauE/SafE family protein [Acidimicrobiales bacterium]
MHIDGYIVLAGVIVGFAVGLTGMGGGALMTPVLVLLLGVQPGAAVSSDLVASVFMKPVGSLVHLRRRTVNLRLVAWLAAGSVPAAFLGAWILNEVASGKALQSDIKMALGWALTLAVAGVALKIWFDRRGKATGETPDEDAPFTVRPLPTLAIGAFGGLIVGMTSVGSGSLMIVALMFLYPRLSTRRLVGNDLVQSVPLVCSAALGQAMFGHVSMAVTTSLLIGSLPAVYAGSRVSATASTTALRPVIAVILLVSGLKLLGVGTTALGVVLGAAVVVGAGYIALRRTAGVRRTLGDAAPPPRAVAPLPVTTATTPEYVSS